MNNFFNIDDSLNNAKDITNEAEIIESTSNPSGIVPFKEEPKEINQGEFKDSEKIRKQLDVTIDKAQLALDVILEEHQLNPSGKSAEATAKLVEAITKLTATLVELNHKEKEIVPSLGNVPKNITNNTLVLGTSDLLEKIIKMRN